MAELFPRTNGHMSWMLCRREVEARWFYEGVGRCKRRYLDVVCAPLCSAQSQTPDSLEPTKDKQINVNWFYGSYVPKEVPLESLNGDQRLKLYIRQTYTTWGIYLKTTLFALSDQAHDRYPEWGDGFGGFAKRLGTREAQFIIQLSVVSLGDGLPGWEPRY